MEQEILTKEDLRIFRVQLMDDLNKIMAQTNTNPDQHSRGYKTKDVRKLLGCSTNKLVSLRISGKLRSKKVGGTVYYCRNDVERLLND